MPFMNAMPGAITQGIIWGIMAIGVYITFKILDVADLTVDGSFATGGAVLVVMVTSGTNLYIAMFCAFLAGCLAGFVTGIFHTKFGIPAILAGILTVEVRVGVVEVAGEIAVVVGPGVLGVVPVEGGVAVLAETEEGRGACRELVAGVVVILDDRHGLVGLAYAGVADLAVLVAPVGVVHARNADTLSVLLEAILQWLAPTESIQITIRLLE